jgi:regulatory protein
MPQISAIKPQKNNKRVNVYLDGKFGFGIDLENFVTLGLKVEQELTEEEIAEIVKKAEFQKTLDKLLRFAALRPRSEKEIKDYFRRKKVHESLHQELFNRLKRLELVDDAKFAQWWVEQRLEFKSKSKRDITQELRTKGIKKEIIEDVLAEVKIDEAKMAKDLLAKKAYKWRGLPRRLAGQKMSQYLAGKGFSWEIIEKLLPKE